MPDNSGLSPVTPSAGWHGAEVAINRPMGDLLREARYSAPRQRSRLIAMGVGLGGAGALLVGRAMAVLLYGVRWDDAATFAAFPLAPGGHSGRSVLLASASSDAGGSPGSFCGTSIIFGGFILAERA